MAFTHYRTQGIFLKKEDKGEADQLFTIFAQNFGKLEILGRAIRKIKSKLRPASDLFYFSEIEFIQGKTYKTLTDAILIDKFKNLREDPKRLEIAHKITESLNVLLGREERDDRIWKLLFKAFKKLNYPLVTTHYSLIYHYFLWNLFSLLGFKPELYNCPVCRKKLLPETFWFLPREGGIVCWRCLREIKEDEKKEIKEISVDTVKILRIFLSEDWKILSRMRISEEAKRNLKEISELYLKFLGGDENL